MISLPAIGRCFFAISMIVFGLQHCVFAVLRTAGIYGPPWIVRSPLVAALLGLVLAGTGLCIFVGYKARAAGALLAAVLFVYVVAIFAPRVAASPRNPGSWTSGAELLCLCGAALVAGGMTPSRSTGSPATEHGKALAEAGRILYALPLIVFGIQHIMYGQFVSTLVPAWIPARLFWAYFVGVAFFAASAILLLNIKRPLAAALLGLMFFTWVVILHAPRIILAMHANEWTSGVVALAMSGGALLLTDKQLGESST